MLLMYFRERQRISADKPYARVHLGTPRSHPGTAGGRTSGEQRVAPHLSSRATHCTGHCHGPIGGRVGARVPPDANIEGKGSYYGFGHVMKMCGKISQAVRGEREAGVVLRAGERTGASGRLPTGGGVGVFAYARAGRADGARLTRNELDDVTHADLL